MPTRKWPLAALVSALVATGAWSPVTAAITKVDPDQIRTELISRTADGGVGNRGSDRPVVSADGTVVAFTSWATDLVDDVDPDQDWMQSYVYDKDTGTMELISRTPNGQPGNNSSWMDDISADGRYVVFTSMATNLVSGASFYEDVYRFDRMTGELDLVSKSLTGGKGNGSSGYASISADGNLVAFSSGASDLVDHRTASDDLFVRDMAAGRTWVVSIGLRGRVADGPTSHGNISDDGRYVVFESDAENLVPGDGNDHNDVFRANLESGAIELVSVDRHGDQADDWSSWPSVSADGRLVAFSSEATQLVSNDENAASDVFVRDMTLEHTRIVSRTAGGGSGSGDSKQVTISPDGQAVAFMTNAHDLVSKRFRGRAAVVEDGREESLRLVLPMRGRIDNWVYPRPTNNDVVAFNTRAKLVDFDDNGALDIYLRSY